MIEAERLNRSADRYRSTVLLGSLSNESFLYSFLHLNFNEQLSNAITTCLIDFTCVPHDDSSNRVLFSFCDLNA